MTGLDLSGLTKFSEIMRTPGTKPAAKASPTGAPLDLALDLIEEDPEQPRKVFEQDALHELAESIRARGVLQAIKVRHHPNHEGHYIVNEGARRYRASLLAGKATIPAVVDNDHEYIDQLIENVQRQNLTVRETIDAVAKLLDQGMKQKDIVSKSGMSKAWVSKYANLRELPAPLASALDAGTCRDGDALVTLKQCWEADEEATRAFLDRAPDELITQHDANALRADLMRPTKEPGSTEEPTATPPSPVKGTTVEGDTKVKQPVIQVRVDGREAVLVPSRRAEYGLLWVEYENGELESLAADKVSLIAVVEGKK